MINPHDRLIEYMTERVKISPSDELVIRDAYSLKSLKKKEFLVVQGEKSLYEAFIIRGTMRVFYTDIKGLEHVLYFGFSDWWVGDITSFYSGERSAFSVQALEETKLLTITVDKKNELLNKVPNLERMFRIITERHLHATQERFLASMSETADQRYLQLLKRSPKIEQLVAQHQIASYLGILPESLSRMKRKLMKEK